MLGCRTPELQQVDQTPVSHMPGICSICFELFFWSKVTDFGEDVIGAEGGSNGDGSGDNNDNIANDDNMAHNSGHP